MSGFARRCDQPPELWIGKRTGRKMSVLLIFRISNGSNKISNGKSALSQSVTPTSNWPTTRQLGFVLGLREENSAGSPEDKARLKEYESGPTANLTKQIMKGFE
jgi:hypothetical protein